MSTPIIEYTPETTKAIINCLNKFGVPANLLGYEYLKSALKLALTDPTAIHSMTKYLYPTVAKDFGTTRNRVEWSIRHAVEVSFNRLSACTIEDTFGMCIPVEKGKVTNREFIAILAEKIRVELGAYD